MTGHMRPHEDGVGAEQDNKLRQLNMEELMEDLLTYDQVAEKFQIKKNTLVSWVRHRKIPFYRVGKAIRFKVSELQEWLANRAVAARYS